MLPEGAEIATPAARTTVQHAHADTTPGMYQIVLEAWKQTAEKWI